MKKKKERTRQEKGFVLTWCLFESSRTSSNAAKESLPRTGSRSMYPKWLSVETMMRKVSASTWLSIGIAEEEDCTGEEGSDSCWLESDMFCTVEDKNYPFSFVCLRIQFNGLWNDWLNEYWLFISYLCINRTSWFVCVSGYCMYVHLLVLQRCDDIVDCCWCMKVYVHTSVCVLSHVMSDVWCCVWLHDSLYVGCTVVFIRIISTDCTWGHSEVSMYVCTTDVRHMYM